MRPWDDDLGLPDEQVRKAVYRGVDGEVASQSSRYNNRNACVTKIGFLSCGRKVGFEKSAGGGKTQQALPKRCNQETAVMLSGWAGELEAQAVHLSFKLIGAEVNSLSRTEARCNKHDHARGFSSLQSTDHLQCITRWIALLLSCDRIIASKTGTRRRRETYSTGGTHIFETKNRYCTDHIFQAGLIIETAGLLGDICCYWSGPQSELLWGFQQVTRGLSEQCVDAAD
eukprot:713658-Amphidinium_carterae.1